MSAPLRRVVGEESRPHSVAGFYDVLECGHKVPQDFGAAGGVFRPHSKRRCKECAKAGL